MGKTFPPGPTWRQFVSIPPSVEGPESNNVMKFDAQNNVHCSASGYTPEGWTVLGKILFESILSISISTGTPKVIKILFKYFLKKYLKYFCKSKYCANN